MNKVKSAQPVILTTGEVLFVLSLIRALDKDTKLKASVADASNMTIEQMNVDLEFLSDKLSVMSFPQ